MIFGSIKEEQDVIEDEEDNLVLNSIIEANINHEHYFLSFIELLKKIWQTSGL